MEPKGDFKTYDKRHLFRMGEENTVYSSGKSKLVAHWRGWNICPMACYDLRFPVWSRNKWNKDKNQMDYDVLIYVANWPAVRVLAWDTLLRSRAIENLSYAVGVNRIGNDGKNVAHNGHSAVVSPKGETIYAAEETEAIKTIKLDAQQLKEYRSKFPAYLDADALKSICQENLTNYSSPLLSLVSLLFFQQIQTNGIYKGDGADKGRFDFDRGNF